MSTFHPNPQGSNLEVFAAAVDNLTGHISGRKYNLEAEFIKQSDGSFLFENGVRICCLKDETQDIAARCDRAERALLRAGYTYQEGAAEWRPPLGSPPVAWFVNDAAEGDKPHWAQVSDEYRGHKDVVPLYRGGSR